MKKLLVLLAIVFMFGCVALEPQPSVCDKPEAEDSVICSLASRMNTTPEQMDFVIRLATAVALDSNPDEAGKALRYLKSLDAVINGNGVTYDAFAKLLKNKPLTFVVAQEVIDNFGGLKNPVGELLPISEFDLNLLNTHIERQKQLIQIAIGD